MTSATRKIPNTLRTFRKLMKYDQKDVAFLLGLKGAGRISEWEKGKSNPSIDNLIKLSIVYRTLCDQLYIHARTKYIPEIREREKQLYLLRKPAQDKGG